MDYDAGDSNRPTIQKMLYPLSILTNKSSKVATATATVTVTVTVTVKTQPQPQPQRSVCAPTRPTIVVSMPVRSAASGNPCARDPHPSSPHKAKAKSNENPTEPPQPQSLRCCARYHHRYRCHHRRRYRANGSRTGVVGIAIITTPTGRRLPAAER